MPALKIYKKSHLLQPLPFNLNLSPLCTLSMECANHYGISCLLGLLGSVSSDVFGCFFCCLCIVTFFYVICLYRVFSCDIVTVYVHISLLLPGQVTSSCCISLVNPLIQINLLDFRGVTCKSIHRYLPRGNPECLPTFIAR